MVVRSKSYLDGIDLQILEKLSTVKPQSEPWPQIGMSVLELAKEIDIKHNSLKPHIDKLMRLNLITFLTFNSGRSDERRLLMTIRDFNKEIVFDSMDSTTDDNKIKELKEDNKRYEIILNTLREIRKMSAEKEIDKMIKLDLRKSESSKKIDYKKELKRLKQNEKKPNNYKKEHKDNNKKKQPKK